MTDSVKRERGRRPLPPLYEAFVTEQAAVSSSKPGESIKRVDKRVIAQIEKCLERAYHGSNEAKRPDNVRNESKVAMRMAECLMNGHNIKQADVLEHQSCQSQSSFAGHSVVAIRRRPNKRVSRTASMDDLAKAMIKYFPGDYYPVKRTRSMDVVLYGIAEQTIAAATAFKTTFNYAVREAQKFTAQNQKNEYCRGIAKGLRTQWNAIHDEEMKRAETAASQSPNEKHSLTQNPSGIDLTWESPAKLTKYHENAAQIAKEWQKSQGVKLGKARKRCREKADKLAYNQGLDDCKKIDLRGNMMFGCIGGCCGRQDWALKCQRPNRYDYDAVCLPECLL